MIQVNTHVLSMLKGVFDDDRFTQLLSMHHVHLQKVICVFFAPSKAGMGLPVNTLDRKWEPTRRTASPQNRRTPARISGAMMSGARSRLMENTSLCPAPLCASIDVLMYAGSAKVDGGCDGRDVDKEEVFTTACVKEEYGDTG